jgi:UDP-glucose 4-epimerase
MRTFLVTGGCGFIGSHLCRALLSRGDAVCVLDDLSTGLLERLPAGARFVPGDVADPATVRRALAGVDGCFHLAAVASVERSNRDWLGAHRTNLTGAVTVFEAATTAAQVPVVYASSAAVYGDGADPPIRETAPVQPISAYAADKLGCELHARAAARTRRLRSVGLRLFNVYGPGQDPHSPYSGVISIFCERIRQGLPVELFGDGHQTRDFIFIGDIVEALSRAMDVQPAGALVLNACTGREISVLELARMIASICRRKLQVCFRPAREGDILRSCGDPSAARQALGLPEPTDFRTGLAATLAWLEDDPRITGA